MRASHAGLASAARRRWLGYAGAVGCAHCAALLPGAALAQATEAAAAAPAWQMPPRHPRPDPGTDEGGLWAIFDREEARLRRSSFVMREGTLREYLLALACRLGGEHCPDTRVYAVRTPAFNATMSPNGMMQVWSGLLLRVENEAQLAAVIGHEMGHYLQRHSLAGLRDAKTRSAFMSLMIPFGAVGLVGQLAAIGGQAAYSRDNEREADRIGLALMARAGYDTREAAAVWANLRAELSAGPGGDPAKRSAMFASHPGIGEREATLTELAQASGGSTGGDIGREALEAQIEPWLERLCEDELSRAQYDETIVLLGRHCARRPQHALLRHFLGEARRLRATPEDLVAAEADLRQALALNPPTPLSHRALGYLYRQRGERAAAAAAFDQYLAAKPGAPDAGLIQSYLSELR